MFNIDSCSCQKVESIRNHRRELTESNCYLKCVINNTTLNHRLQICMFITFKVVYYTDGINRLHCDTCKNIGFRLPRCTRMNPCQDLYSTSLRYQTHSNLCSLHFWFFLYAAGGLNLERWVQDLVNARENCFLSKAKYLLSDYSFSSARRVWTVHTDSSFCPQTSNNRKKSNLQTTNTTTIRKLPAADCPF